MVTMEFDLDISDESLDCLIEMAGYGIAYWASEATQDDEARTYTIIENEEGENEVHVIPFDKIKEAFWRVANPGAKIKGLNQNHTVKTYALNAIKDGLEEGNGDIDAGHIDADLADIVIQVAAFGEVVYG